MAKNKDKDRTLVALTTRASVVATQEYRDQHEHGVTPMVEVTLSMPAGHAPAVGDRVRITWTGEERW